jgi:hypothetical protein
VGLVFAATGTVSMAELPARLADLPDGVRTGLNLLLLVAFGINAAVFPLFFWLPDSLPTAPSSVAARPISDAARRLRERQARWKRKVAWMLLMTHLSRQLQRGQHGAKALAALAWLLVRVVAGAVRQATLKMARTALRRQPGLQAATGATTAVKEGTTPATA